MRHLGALYDTECLFVVARPCGSMTKKEGAVGSRGPGYRDQSHLLSLLLFSTYATMGGRLLAKLQ